MRHGSTYAPLLKLTQCCSNPTNHPLVVVVFANTLCGKPCGKPSYIRVRFSAQTAAQTRQVATTSGESNDPSWTWSVACRAVSSSSRCDSKKLPFWGRRACFGVPVWSLGGPQLFTNVDGCFSAYLDPFSRDYPVVTPVTPCI